MNPVPVPDNIFWAALAGPHALFTVGTPLARRYAPGFSPIVAFPDLQRPRFDALAPYCESGEHFYCDGWSGEAPVGWRIDVQATMFRMVWVGGDIPPDDCPQAVRLRPEHAAQAIGLAALTRPGPFGPRTPELGEYFGCFDGERLMAMAGERMFTSRLRELSGVCTHPDFAGRGLARRLVSKLVRRQMLRGETPFLHVMSSNAGAHGLYLRMGFRDHCETVVRVVSRC